MDAARHYQRNVQQTICLGAVTSVLYVYHNSLSLKPSSNLASRASRMAAAESPWINSETRSSVVDPPLTLIAPPSARPFSPQPHIFIKLLSIDLNPDLIAPPWL